MISRDEHGNESLLLHDAEGNVRIALSVSRDLVSINLFGRSATDSSIELALDGDVTRIVMHRTEMHQAFAIVAAPQETRIVMNNREQIPIVRITCDADTEKVRGQVFQDGKPVQDISIP